MMPPSSNVKIRPAGPADHERIVWALCAAAGWKPDGKLPPIETLINLPELARYHRGWGRPGDLGVIAELEEEFVGVAFCRLFDEDEPGYGFVDTETPELCVAVVEQFRARGIGTLLMEELAEAARRAGAEALSLSVEIGNPARRLYDRLGFREVSVEGPGVRMLRNLNPER